MAQPLVDPRQRVQAARAREIGLRRLRHVTLALTAGAAALTGIFAGIGAASVPGRKLTHASPRTHHSVARRRVRQLEVPAPTPRLPASSADEIPAPPAAAPTASGAPPVVVSGGS